MSKNEKVALWVSAAIGIIVLAWLMYMRRNATTGSVSPYSAGTGQAAAPGNVPWTASANGLPTVPSASLSSGCNGCSRSNGIFNSVGQMLNYFTSKSTDIFNNYQQQVYAAYPDSVTQYFNNPVGGTESANARAVMKAY